MPERRSRRSTRRRRTSSRSCTAMATRPSAACRRSARCERPGESDAVSDEQLQPVRVGVVGLGYWGPNLARNLDSIAGCELAWLCDADEEKRERLRGPLPPGLRARLLGE